MRLSAHGGTGPLPHPATHKILPLGGRVGERAGATSEIALSRFQKQDSQVPGAPVCSAPMPEKPMQ